MDFSHAHDAARTIDHQEHQHQRHEHHPPDSQRTQDFQQYSINYRADDRSGNGGDAAQINHDQNIGGFENVEHARVDKLQGVGEQASGNAREKRGNDKGDDFDLTRVDAHQVAGDFIFADGQNAASEIGINEVADHPDR